MSAILFSQEEEQSAESTDRTINNSNVGIRIPHCNNTNEEILSSSMASLDLNRKISLQHDPPNFDGSDSGVEVTTHATVTLYRALSNNSGSVGGGYASSNGGILDDATSSGLNVSCDSSMISCGSDICAPASFTGANSSDSFSNNVYTPPQSNVTVTVCRSNSIKSKLAVFDSYAQSERAALVRERDRDFTFTTPTRSTQLNKSRPRASLGSNSSSSLKRTASLPRPSLSAMAQARERGGERQSMTGSLSRTPQPRPQKPQKPDSLPSALNTPRLVQRTASLNRARTPATPSTPDDGRWPSVNSSRNLRRGVSATPDATSTRMRTSMLAANESRSLINPYSTLPRQRKQKSVEDLTGQYSRSSSVSRETRMTSSVVLGSRRNLVSSLRYPSTTGQGQQVQMPPPMNANTTNMKSTVNRKQQQKKTRIYHETSAQTAITCADLELAFAGKHSTVRAVDAPDICDKQTQSDIRDFELERLREDKMAMQEELHLNFERVRGILEMARVASGGRSTEAVTPSSDGSAGHESLLMLESQIQISGHELNERQQEIAKLRQLCRSLHQEVERSLTVQECLLQEKAAIEQESTELQDFLQHEKSAMFEALKELEAEHQMNKQKLEQRDEEVKVLRDECRHLVRLNEQRRQENQMLQSKCNALETKSKESIIQQNSAISCASTALSRLHKRLDDLVEQLVSSYSISEQDLEDFQTDTPSNTDQDSNESENQKSKTTNGLDLATYENAQLPQPPSEDLSPERHKSFIAAVISAIRNATGIDHSSGKKSVVRNAKRANNQQHSNSNHNGNGNNNNFNNITGNGDDSDSTEMLDSETEPCLMMDNVLEDVTMPDSHSHNMVSSHAGMISQIDVPSEILNGDESLQNLSQAIANRQQMELQMNAAFAVPTLSVQLSQRDNNVGSHCEDLSCHDSIAEMPSLVEYSVTQAVVDQVIEVDSLVTKLLKVLRLIQMDNDNCIQQLIVDKNKLQQNKEDMLEKIKDLQDVNVKLQDDLMDATQELMLKNNDLSSSKAEVQRHRNEIDRLTEDICNLSTLCSNYKKLSPTTEFPDPMPNMLLPKALVDDDEIIGIIGLFKMWHTEGQLKDVRIQSFLHKICGHDEHSTNNPQTQENQERLRIYANQLENVLKVLGKCKPLENEFPALQQLREDIETVQRNAGWAHIVEDIAVTLSSQNDNESNQNYAVADLDKEDSETGDLNANATNENLKITKAADNC